MLYQDWISQDLGTCWADDRVGDNWIGHNWVTRRLVAKWLVTKRLVGYHMLLVLE